MLAELVRDGLLFIAAVAYAISEITRSKRKAALGKRSAAFEWLMIILIVGIVLLGLTMIYPDYMRIIAQQTMRG